MFSLAPFNTTSKRADNIIRILKLEWTLLLLNFKNYDFSGDVVGG